MDSDDEDKHKEYEWSSVVEVVQLFGDVDWIFVKFFEVYVFLDFRVSSKFS